MIKSKIDPIAAQPAEFITNEEIKLLNAMINNTNKRNSQSSSSSSVVANAKANINPFNLHNTQATFKIKMSHNKFRINTNKQLENRSLFLNHNMLSQCEQMEKFVWNFQDKQSVVNYKQQIDMASRRSSHQIMEKQLNVSNETILKIITQSINRNSIYDYFKMTQFQKCCTLLTNLYRPFDQNLNTSLHEEEQTNVTKSIVSLTINSSAEHILDYKMLLYYSTICGLYPSLYCRSLPSSSLSTRLTNDSTKNETFAEEVFDDSSYINQTKLSKTADMDMNNKEDLEITSEGLCDHIREIFGLSRQIFNDYQVKAMKKLLIRKSHPQILKEELLRQFHIISNNKHPCYKKENFHSEKCYEIWRDQVLNKLKLSIENFSHVPVDEDSILYNEEALRKYADKLNTFSDYYDQLMEYVFRNLFINKSFRLTSNSKRLLKEFQLRYCVDSFDALIIELKHFTKSVETGTDQFLFESLTTYFKQVNFYLTLNKIQLDELNHSYPILMNTLFNLISCLENAHNRVVEILKHFKTFYPDPDDSGQNLNTLIELLQEADALNQLLNRTSTISVNDSIKIYFKDGLEKLYYDTRKKIIEANINSKIVSYLDTNVVYSLLIFTREQISFYRKSSAKCTLKDFDVLELIINTFYAKLMKDVKSLCEDHLEELYDSTKLNLNLLALGYRLNQFDLECGDKLKLETQIWRSYFMPQLYNWIVAVGEICVKMIYFHFIPSDKFGKIDLKKEIDAMFSKRLNDSNKLKSRDASSSSANQSTLVVKQGNLISTTTTSTNSLLSDETSNTKRSAFRPFIGKTTQYSSFDRTTYKTSTPESTDLVKSGSHSSPLFGKTLDANTKTVLKNFIKDDQEVNNEHQLTTASGLFRTLSLDKLDQEHKVTHKRILSDANIQDVVKAQLAIIDGPIKQNINELHNASQKAINHSKSSYFKPISMASSSITLSSSHYSTSLHNNHLRDRISKHRDNKLDVTASKIYKYDRFSCSTSLVDLLVLIFRYKDVCEKLIDLFVPHMYQEIDQTHNRIFQLKFNCMNNMYQVIFKYIDTYASNIMSLDICGATKKNLDNFFEKDIVDDILSGKMDDVIWGCRHKLKNCKYDCNHFINRNSKFISDSFEPVDEMMCIRLNNIMQLKEIRAYFYQRYNSVMQKQYNYLLKIKSKRTMGLFQQFKMEMYKIKVLNKTLEYKIDSLSSGLLSLLVYRFNLFCKRAKIFLLSNELDSLPISIRLKPLVEFLTCNFDMLKQQLYPSLFAKFMRALWNCFYNTFVELVEKFNDEGAKKPRQKAFTYLKVIDILMMKFKEYSVSFPFMESKIKKLKFILQIYSQSSNNLILLYYKLFNFNNQKHSSLSLSPLSSNANVVDIPDRFDIIHLVKMCKKLKKSFNGKYFISYLKKFPPNLLSKSDVISKDMLIRYAQSLLEAGYLFSIETKIKRKKISKLAKPSSLRLADQSEELEMERMSGGQATIGDFDLFNFDQIFLATKTNYYKLNSSIILKLTDNLLFRNSVLNQEIETLYPNYEILIDSKYDMESNELLDKCLENSIDQDFILKALWHYIYIEPIVMKFISMRYSNYASNLYFIRNDTNRSKNIKQNETSRIANKQTTSSTNPKWSDDILNSFHII